MKTFSLFIQTINKKIAVVMTALLLTFSPFTFADNAKNEMWLMMNDNKALLKAESKEDFLQAAQQLRDDALKAASIRPSTITNEADFKQYQAAMQHFIQVLDLAIQQATQSDLKQAQETRQQLQELKTKYHRKFK